MTKAIGPLEAGAALSEVRRRQSEAIQRSLVPTWYWWIVAVPMVGLGVVVDRRDPAAIASAAVIFAVVVGLLTAWTIVGGLRQVRVRQDLLGPRGAGLIVAFVGSLVGGTIGLAFTLQAMTFPNPATIATIACALTLVLGGPALMRTLREMMRRRAAVDS